MKKKILVQISGLQFEKGRTGPESSEPVELITEGVYRKVAGRHHIKYDENISGGTEMTRSHVIIDKSCIEVHKKGEVDVDMVFEMGKTKISSYKTRYGTMDFGISTTGLEMREMSDSLAAFIRYTLSVDDQYAADCTMEMTFRNL